MTFRKVDPIFCGAVPLMSPGRGSVAAAAGQRSGNPREPANSTHQAITADMPPYDLPCVHGGGLAVCATSQAAGLPVLLATRQAVKRQR